MESGAQGGGKPLSGMTGAGITESDRKLRRELSFMQLLFLSLGGIIGSGWLFAVISAAGLAGPAVVVSWIVGGILVILVAITYAEVAGAIPRSGAIVRYPHLTHGGYTGYILGWAYLLSAVSVPTIEAIAVVTYASTYIPPLLGPTVHTVLGTATLLSGYGILMAFLLLVAFFFLNFFGIKFLGRFNQAFTWWKLIIPTLTFIFLFAAFRGSNFTAGGSFAPLGWAPVFEAIPLAGIVFSYLGFRQALDFGGEAKNPQRDVPLATILSVVIGIVVYTLLQVAFIGGIRWSAAGVSVGDWAALAVSPWSGGPFFDALTASGIAFLGAFASLLLVDAWISPSGTGWIYTGTSSRTFYGLSADGYFGSLFLPVSKKYGIPWVALLAALVVALLFLVPFPSWYLLVGFISSATVFTYIMGGVALQVFRWNAPRIYRPFRLTAGPVFAPIAFVAASLIVYWSGFGLVSVLALMVFAGLVIFILVYAPVRLGVQEDVAYATGITFLALLASLAGYWYYYLEVPFANGASASTLSSNFVTFFGGIAALVLVTSLVLWLAAARERKREIAAGIWIIVFTLVVLALSFYGAFGYDVVIPFPWDNVAMVIAALLLYGFALFSSYKTPELAALEQSLGDRPMALLSEGGGPGGSGASPGPGASK